MHDLEELFARFLLQRRAAGVSTATVRWYEYWHRYFLAYLMKQGGGSSLENISVSVLLRFLADLREREVCQTPHRRPCGRKMSPWTVNTAYRALRAFFNWAEKEGLLNENPIRHIKEPKVPQNDPPVFSRREIKALLETAMVWGEKPLRTRNTLIVQLLFDTGIRVSELAGLTLDDVIPDQGAIRIRGKGAKERLVPIGIVVQNNLVKYIMKGRRCAVEHFFCQRKADRSRPMLFIRC